MLRLGQRWRIAAASLVTLWASEAHAQATDPAAAQSLFDEGKRLMGEKNFAAACPKLAESQKLDPSAGTVIALALCHEGEGKTATAWAEFVQAQSDARRDKRADREAAASEHIRALEPRLVKVRVVVTKPADGLEVKRDGVALGSAAWSVPVAVDPGPHLFEATAPQKQRWSSIVELRDEGKVTDVVVPALAEAPLPAASNPGTALPKVDPAPSRAPVDEDEAGGNRRTIGLVAGGVGILGLGVGAFFGLNASSKWSDAEEACPGNVCPSVSAAQAGKDAGTSANLSTAFVVIGAVALAGGAALYLTAPSAPAPKARAVRVVPWASAEGGGAVVGGSL